jgi:hypothetical protein
VVTATAVTAVTASAVTAASAASAVTAASAASAVTAASAASAVTAASAASAVTAHVSSASAPSRSRAYVIVNRCRTAGRLHHGPDPAMALAKDSPACGWTVEPHRDRIR